MPDLERHLRALDEHDDLYPPTPDIASTIPARTWITPREDRRRTWQPFAVIAALVLVALLVALAVPATRTAIASFFGIAGIQIEFVDDSRGPIPGTPLTLGGSLVFGEQTTLDAAQTRAPFAVRLPDAIPAPPDEVYVSERTNTTVVTLLWRSGPELPRIGESDAGLLLFQIASADDQMPFARKLASAGQIEETLIAGRPAYWIEDGVLVMEPDGPGPGVLEPVTRRSGNVLIWSDGEITYRLETALPRTGAERLAASLHPTSGAGNP